MRLNLSQYSLPSEKLALSDEDPGALDTLKAKLRAEHQPVNETEEILVNEMAEQFWRLRRARVLETSLLDSDKVMIPHLAAIQRMMSSAERGFHKALRALRQLQKDRGFVPQKEQSGSLSESASALGFVSQSDRNPDCQGGVKLTADRCALTAPSGFVPPPCPEDEDINPADWAGAFEARHRVHAKSQS
jgi:hypothetical protein